MRKASCFWLLVTLSCSAWVCRGQTVEDGEYVVDFADWPMNGVPFVSEDGQVYPSYEERATLVWAGMVCAFSPSHFSPFTVFLVFFHSFLHVTGCNWVHRVQAVRCTVCDRLICQEYLCAGPMVLWIPNVLPPQLQPYRPCKGAEPRWVHWFRFRKVLQWDRVPHVHQLVGQWSRHINDQNVSIPDWHKDDTPVSCCGYIDLWRVLLQPKRRDRLTNPWRMSKRNRKWRQTV